MNHLATLLRVGTIMISIVAGWGDVAGACQRPTDDVWLCEYSTDLIVDEDPTVCPVVEQQAVPDLCAMGYSYSAAEASQVLTHARRTAMSVEPLPDRGTESCVGPHQLLCSSILDDRSGPLLI